MQLEEAIGIDTDPLDEPDSKEERMGFFVKTAEAYRKLGKDLIGLLEEKGHADLVEFDYGEQSPKNLPGNIFEAVKDALEQQVTVNPDLELIVRTVLEFQGINFDDLLPHERNLIFNDLERAGIDRPKPKKK